MLLCELTAAKASKEMTRFGVNSDGTQRIVPLKVQASLRIQVSHVSAALYQVTTVPLLGNLLFPSIMCLSAGSISLD